MSDLPRFGQYAAVPRQEQCPRHPGETAVDYCKRCNRPTCAQCTIPTEVGSICVDCARPTNRRRAASLGLRSGPVVTYAIMAVTFAVYLIGRVWPTIDTYLAFNPVLAAVQPWRFLTVSLVHGGFLHILFNMMMLYFLGAGGEKILGHWRFLGLYTMSTLGGSVAVLAWALIQPQSLTVWTVGASGAIYGLFGAVLVQQLRNRINPTSILVLLAINLIYSFTAGGVSWQGHLGGLIAGALMAWIYAVLAQPRIGVTQRKQNIWEALATLGMVVVLGAISYGLYQPLIG
ncbi:rhomboid family intramembrane serine protease [Actinomyces sp. F1_1611]